VAGVESFALNPGVVALASDSVFVSVFGPKPNPDAVALAGFESPPVFSVGLGPKPKFDFDSVVVVSAEAALAAASVFETVKPSDDDQQQLGKLPNPAGLASAGFASPAFPNPKDPLDSVLSPTPNIRHYKRFSVPTARSSCFWITRSKGSGKISFPKSGWRCSRFCIWFCI